MDTDVPADLPLRIAVLAVSLCLSAFFSGSETALFSFQPDELKRSAGAGGADGLIARLRGRPRRLLTVILFGNMVANVLFFSVSFLLLVGLKGALGAGGVVALSVASLAVVLVLGEVVPKNLAVTFYRPVGRLVAWPMAAIQAVLLPVIWPLEWIADASASLVGRGSPAVRAEELQALVSLGAREGVVDPALSEMLADVIGLSDVRISELMVPRVEMTTFDLRRPRHELLDLFRRTKLDVVTVYDGDPENVAGVVRMKDVAFGPPHEDLRVLVSEIPYLPETATAEEALRLCRRDRRRTAFVVDEYGTVVGMVTLEVLIEEVVGDIASEYEPEQPLPIRPLGAGAFRVQGGVSLRDWEEAVGVEAPEMGVDTVGGLVMALLDKVPEVGDSVRWNGVELTVESVEGRRAATVITRLTSGRKEAEAGDA